MIELLVGAALLLWTGGVVGYIVGFYDGARRFGARR